jgi:hypothetical protein
MYLVYEYIFFAAKFGIQTIIKEIQMMITAAWCGCIYLPFGWNKGPETADLGSEYQTIAQNFFTPHSPPSPEFQSHWSRILADLVAKFT